MKRIIVILCFLLSFMVISIFATDTGEVSVVKNELYVGLYKYLVVGLFSMLFSWLAKRFKDKKFLGAALESLAEIAKEAVHHTEKIERQNFSEKLQVFEAEELKKIAVEKIKSNKKGNRLFRNISRLFGNRVAENLTGKIVEDALRILKIK